MSEKQIVLTRNGLKRVQDELHQLQTIRRHEVTENIRAAKDLGDVTENSEYETAKTEQAFLEGQISELKGIIGAALIIDEADIRTDEVSIGSVVKVHDLENDEEWEYTVVGSYEADPEEDRISNESPIGEALFARKPGDTIEIKVPAGTVHYRIISIRRPDA